VTHQMLHVSNQYSPATTLIPMIHNIQGNRAIMGSKMGTQALPLLEREVPFVQVKSHLPGEVSFETVYGHLTVPKSPVHGTVEKIQDGYIYIRPHGEKKAFHAVKEAGVGIDIHGYHSDYPAPPPDDSDDTQARWDWWAKKDAAKIPTSHDGMSQGAYKMHLKVLGAHPEAHKIQPLLTDEVYDEVPTRARLNHAQLTTLRDAYAQSPHKFEKEDAPYRQAFVDKIDHLLKHPTAKFFQVEFE